MSAPHPVESKPGETSAIVPGTKRLDFRSRFSSIAICHCFVLEYRYKSSSGEDPDEASEVVKLLPAKKPRKGSKK